jgi:hypothetical protein
MLGTHWKLKWNIVGTHCEQGKIEKRKSSRSHPQNCALKAHTSLWKRNLKKKKQKQPLIPTLTFFFLVLAHHRSFAYN